MSEEKRKHLRLPVESQIFIELVSPAMGDPDSGKIALCNTLDVSREGLQVSLKHELTVGAILHIGVQMPDAKDTLYLAAEVEWCLPEEGDQPSWSAGFKLLNANNSDIDSWVSLLREMDS